MSAIQYYMATTVQNIPLASPMEPETTRAVLAFDKRPKVPHQFNIDGWVKDIKTAAGLVHGVDNLANVYDVAYLLGTNTRYNTLIDFVSGTKKAFEFEDSQNRAVFTPWLGWTNVDFSIQPINTGWNITSLGNNGIPSEYHYHVSILSESSALSSNSLLGTTYLHFIPLRSPGEVATTNGGWQTSAIPSTNTKGAYTVKRVSTSTISMAKNTSGDQFSSNSNTDYRDFDFYLFKVNNGGPPYNSTIRTGTTISSFTAGSKDVDSALLATADRNYFLNYGKDLFSV